MLQLEGKSRIHRHVEIHSSVNTLRFSSLSFLDLDKFTPNDDDDDENVNIKQLLGAINFATSFIYFFSL